ncbi:MAG: beta-ketoacyl-ACP synthase II [Candidatus Muirbacterium halophilum]|nr:beta-ketoacyl-ACP synthase II [Candidatus Muirbacterium halophilum]MCK9477029.1 beta-ketoacyl-ACP synthase II [Candidatus Muirbacterium halophilum]
MERRVVITGIGAVTPIGIGIDEYFKALKIGKSGIGPITSFDTEGFPSKIAGEVKNFEPSDYFEPKEAKRMDRYCQFALASAKMAYKDSGIDLEKINRKKAGVILGVGMGGLNTYESQMAVYNEKGPRRVTPFLVPMMISNLSAGTIGLEFGLKGPNYVVTAACASSTHAIGEAFLKIKNNMCDICFTGGSESTITPLTVAGFGSMKALSTRNEEYNIASSPFDVKRDGFVIAEGGGVLILEELQHAIDRGAKIYGEMVGYGLSDDAYHMTQPHPDAEGATSCIQMAIDMANIKPEQIDYINAHGTSTPFNDRLETKAIKNVFGDYAKKIAISSTKSMTGHLLGGAGAIEAIACCMVLNEGIIPPTINYQDVDPECDLNYTPNKFIEKNVNFTLSNSFGFGGQNSSIIFKKYENK